MGAVKEKGQGQSLVQNIMAVCHYVQHLLKGNMHRGTRSCANTQTVLLINSLAVLCTLLQVTLNTTHACTQ